MSAPITSAALQAINRLLVYQVVPLPTSASLEVPAHLESPPGLRLAVSDIARAISHCRFEPSDPSVDELVLLRILAVMKELVCGTRQVEADGQGLTLADLLSDESICEMMETGLSMCCQTRLSGKLTCLTKCEGCRYLDCASLTRPHFDPLTLSDLLRKTAEQNLLPMVRHIFSRLPLLSLQADEKYSAEHDVAPDHTSLAAEDVEEVVSAADPDEKRLRRMTMPDPGGLLVNPASSDSEAQAQALSTADEEDEGESGAQEAIADKPEGSTQDDSASAGPAEVQGYDLSGASDDRRAATSTTGAATPAPAQASGPAVEPFSLPAIKELLRVLISLLDPQSASHTDSMRLLGLNLLTAAFETAGAHLSRFPSLRSLLQDTGCKFLFQLSRSDSFAISSYATRSICTLFEVMKEDLKLQYELLVTFLLDRLAPTVPMSQEPWNESLQAIATAVPQRLASGNSDAPPPPPPPPMPKSSDKAPATGDVRDLTLEALALLLGVYKPGLGVMGAEDVEDPLLGLFLNYDCDVDCDDLYTKMIHYLCRSVFTSSVQLPGPPQGPASNASIQDGSQVFALDMVLSFVERLTARQEQGDDYTRSWPEDFPVAENLELSKSKKDAILEGARRFNAKPKVGLAYLEEQGFIAPDASGSKEKSIARFLKDCPRLDKKLLGDYISRPDNIGVLDAFIRLFDFEDVPVAEAMREMLESFRLPGESQQINRIAETFAKIYFVTAPKDLIKSEDAVYVLAYSVIMLNTDLHNAQNKRKMKVDDYRRNLRGVNDGADFDPDFLGSIYESIRKREIVMPEEHLGQLGFEYAWKELLRRSRTSTKLKCPRTNRFDRAMFSASWKPIVACIAYAFSTFRDEHLLERAISAFRQCAILASKWGMDEVFDFMIEGLAANTGLLDPSGTLPASGSPNNATVQVEGSSVTVSPLSVRFGMDFKGQLAAVVLFTIANGNGAAIRGGWTPIFEIFKNLFASGLLPEDLTTMCDFTAKASARPALTQGDGTETPKATQAADSRAHLVSIPLKPKKAAGVPAPDPRAQGSGLFSTLSSYLLSPYSGTAESAPPDVTAEDVESSLCTADCVASCRVSEIYHQLLALESSEGIISAVKALRQLADRLTLGQLAAAAATQQQDGVSGRSTPVQQPAAPRTQPLQQLPYDPRAIFALELLTNLTCSASKFISATWKESVAHISSLLQSPRSFHPALLERAVVCLLRIVDAGSEQGLSAEVVSALELLRGLPTDIKPSLNASIVAGLQDLLCKPRRLPFLESQSEWNGVLSLVSDSFSTRSAQNIDLLYSLVSTISALHLSASNFVSTVQLLRDIAQAADPEPMLKEIHKREKQGYRLTLTEKKELTEYVEMCRQKGPEAIRRLEEVQRSVPGILQASEQDARGAAAVWSECWLTLTSALASQCVNAHRPTRQAALSALQQVLLSSLALSHETSPPWGIRQVFLTSLFPLLDHLLSVSPQTFAPTPREREQAKGQDLVAAPGGLLETRVRAVGVLCHTLINFLGPISRLPAGEIQELWSQVLDLLARYAQAAGKDKAQEPLREAISENLKGAMLAMRAWELLMPPTAGLDTGKEDTRSPSQAALWAITEDKVTRFMPWRDLASIVQSEDQPRPGVSAAPTEAPVDAGNAPTQPHGLFRGAVTAQLPIGLIDASGEREVPAHQEVRLFPNSDVTCVVEVLEAVDQPDPESAVKHHFSSLAQANEASSSTVLAVAQGAYTAGEDQPPPPAILTGVQQARRGEGESTVRVHLALWRLSPRKNTDLVMSWTEPVQAPSGAGAEEEAPGDPAVSRAFVTAATTLRIADWESLPA